MADTPEMDAAIDAGMASLGWPKGQGPEHFREAIQVALRSFDARDRPRFQVTEQEHRRAWDAAASRHEAGGSSMTIHGDFLEELNVVLAARVPGACVLSEIEALICIESDYDGTEAAAIQAVRRHVRRVEELTGRLKESGLAFATAKDECHAASEELRSLREACQQLHRHCLANGDYHRPATESGAAYEDVAERIQKLLSQETVTACDGQPITLKLAAEHFRTFRTTPFTGAEVAQLLETGEMPPRAPQGGDPEAGLRQRLERLESASLILAGGLVREGGRLASAGDAALRAIGQEAEAPKDADRGGWEVVPGRIITNLFVKRTGRQPNAGESVQLFDTSDTKPGVVLTMGEDGVWRGQAKQAAESGVARG